LGEVASRVFSAGVHPKAFRTADEAAAKNEEAVETAGIFHGGLRALEHAVGFGDLLSNVAEFLAIRSAASLRDGKLLLKLHTADLLLAYLRQACPGASDKAGATKREHTKVRPDEGPEK